MLLVVTKLKLCSLANSLSEFCSDIVRPFLIPGECSAVLTGDWDRVEAGVTKADDVVLLVALISLSTGR